MSWFRRPPLQSALFILALVIVAAALPPGSARPAQAASQTVRITELGFQPASVSITTGDTVVWTNEGIVQHVVADEAGTFNSGLIAPGQSFSQTFATAGVVNYGDPGNPVLRGTVTIAAQVTNPRATPVAASGGAVASTAQGTASSTFSGSANLLVVVDEPGVNGSIFGPTTVRGWAIDTTAQGGPGIASVEAYLDGNRASAAAVGGVTYGLSRTDVATNRNDQAVLNSGYTVTFDASQLSPGRHSLTVAVRGNGGATAERTVPVIVGPPIRVQADANVVPGGGGYGGPGFPGWGAGFPPGFGPGFGGGGGLAVQVNARVTVFGRGVPGAQVSMGGVQFPPTDPDGYTRQLVPLSQIQPNGLVGRVRATLGETSAEADVYIYNYY